MKTIKRILKEITILAIGIIMLFSGCEKTECEHDNIIDTLVINNRDTLVINNVDTVINMNYDTVVNENNDTVFNNEINSGNTGIGKDTLLMDQVKNFILPLDSIANLYDYKMKIDTGLRGTYNVRYYINSSHIEYIKFVWQDDQVKEIYIVFYIESKIYQDVAGFICNKYGLEYKERTTYVPTYIINLDEFILEYRLHLNQRSHAIRYYRI